MADQTEEGKQFDATKFDITNPETYPEDPELLAQLIDKADRPQADPDSVDNADAEAKAKADADAKAAADAKAKEEADAKAKAEEKPEGVLLADGKKILPYEVLAETRRREDAERRGREEAEKRVREAELRVKELEAERDAGGDRPAGSSEKTKAIREKIEALKQDVPEVAGLFDEVLGAMAALEEQVGDFREQQEAQVARERGAAANRVQTAIDSIPALRFWQNDDVDKFNEAAGYDRQLRENPKFQHLSTQERFERVVGIMEGLHGPTEIPEKYKDVQHPSVSGKPQDDAAAKAAAEAKAKKEADEKARAEALAKGKGGDRPLTLSDLPGGMPPQSGQKALEEMTTGDIAASVERMLDSGKGVEEILASYNRP